jgi:hypothetical protein
LLAYLFERCEQLPPNPSQQDIKTADEIRVTLFGILETLAKNTKLLMQNQKDIMDSLLPVIIKKVESKSADIRF